MENKRIIVILPKYIIDAHEHPIRAEHKTSIKDVLLDAHLGMIHAVAIMPNSPESIISIPVLDKTIETLEALEKEYGWPKHYIWFGLTDNNLDQYEYALEYERVVGGKVYPKHPKRGVVTTASGEIGMTSEVALRRAMYLTRRKDKTIAYHGSDPEIMARENGEDTIEGEVAYDKFFLETAEDVPGVKIWKAHLSNIQSGKLFESAVRLRMRVMLEECSHYQHFSCDYYNWNLTLPEATYKCFNGIRDYNHMVYLRQLPERFPNNVVHSSDDARHASWEKSEGWEKAPGGLPGNKHLVRATVTLGYERGWSAELYDRVLRRNASEFLGIDVSDERVEVAFELCRDKTLYNDGRVINPYLDMEMFQPV